MSKEQTSQLFSNDYQEH